ncbi:uncharacterized protein ColSpa_05850 [Colletotrichum spaethianum]|uniref:Glycosyltransferase family 31 protein n=1 Tax=Colletotrichum spaethianum TaxID=700344 RepID=A0AA37LE09_9PEZI|nr:uncharacterized protein ColSpa_05850 [Colletotrichum spaethianum]GKT45669.1 hypothetical protein ColSpa_05850 [Colletotrichum spaethianum]
MQPLHGYHNHARALHAATFLLVLMFILIQVVRGRQDAYQVIDTDPLVPLLNLGGNKMTQHDTNYLRILAERNNITDRISWFSQRIKVVPEAPRRFPMTNIKQGFAENGFQNIRWDDDDSSRETGGAVKVLPVTKSPKPATVDASNLLFGVSTSYNRLTYDNDSLIGDWKRWLTNGRGSSNGATVVVTLHQTTSEEAWEIYEKLHEVGIDATVVPLGKSVEKTSRYLDMIAILLDTSEALAEQGRPKQYLGLIDDDIFFPTPGQLISRLSKFDTSSPYYIGLPSERPDWSVENDTAVTHGGSAIFLTPPAALIISHLPCRPTMGFTGNHTRWDNVLHDCVRDHTDIPFHILPSFYSPTDALYNMQAATYDLGVSPLTLRHYRSRHGFSPSLAHLVTSICGEACFLQRFHFGGNWVLANGNSITHYCGGFNVVPMESDAKLLGSMQYGQEAEMPLGEGIVLSEVRETKEVVTWSGTRNVWNFLDAVVGERGEVWQAYVKRRGRSGFMNGEVEDEDGDGDHLDSVIVLVWEP